VLIGAVEAGGTKFVCGVGNEKGDIIDYTSFPTTGPEQTLYAVYDYFSAYNLQALGVGSFGPIDLDSQSKTYGYITATPKRAWTNYPFLQMLKEHFSIPIAFSTDVNIAAFGEYTFGAARGLNSCIYMTVGTGIGVGAVVGGDILHGMSHPEMGHIFVKRHPSDSFSGVCSYHGDCLEGLASGPAIEQRWNEKAYNLPVQHQGWEIEADYLAQALMNYILILSPKRIILGGGVMKQTHLFPMIRRKLDFYMNDYIQHPLLQELDTYIVPASLGDLAGLKGGIAFAKQFITRNPKTTSE